MVTHQPLLHVSARRELHSLPTHDRRELRRVIKDVAASPQPSHHEKCKQMEGQPEVFRIRTGDCRAVCTLQKPALYVLRIGKRNGVYQEIDTVIANRRPADAPSV